MYERPNGIDNLLKYFSGVQKIMVTGTSVKGSKEALRLTRIYPNTLYSTAGIFFFIAISLSFHENNSLLKQLIF